MPPETQHTNTNHDKKVLREIGKLGMADEMDLWIAMAKQKKDLDPLLDSLNEKGLIKRVKKVNKTVPMDGFILTLDGQRSLGQ